MPLLLRFWGVLLASGGVPVALAQPAPPAGESLQQGADCRTLLERLNKLMQMYKAAAAEDIKNQPFDKAMDNARKEALAGKKDATIRLVGYTSLIQAREGSYPIHVVRQVCTFAERNGLPLHVATCAYFHTLNPLGEAEPKAAAARKAIARFEASKEPPADLVEHVGVLKACLPPKP